MTDLPHVEGLHIPPTKDRVPTQALVTHFSDWLATLRLKKTQGQLTDEQEQKIVARSMAALYRGKERMKNKAYTDALTGLPNRRAFNEALASIGGEDVAVLILDLDHFKAVNDKYGHPAGDSVLAQVGFTLSTSLRQNRETEAENDIIARYGGEEMAVILRNITDPEKAREIAEKLRESVGSTPIVATVDGLRQEIPITVSIGGGLITQGQNPMQMVEAIDKQGLYQAKDNGRNNTFMLGDQVANG